MPRLVEVAEQRCRRVRGTRCALRLNVCCSFSRLTNALLGRCCTHRCTQRLQVNGDGGLDTGHLVIPSLLASTVGLGWSKDNLRTADRCYVDGLYPNGTVKWPCGSVNAGEGTSGTFKMQIQQTVLATLSLGPVGIADQLSSYPGNTSADITSNKTLVMATCAATGDLLQPGYPLAPLDQYLLGYVNGVAPKWGWLWGSYTSVSTHLWYLAYGGGTTVTEADLAPMVDATALPAATFGEIPTGAFGCDGSTIFPNSSAVSAHVAWRSRWMGQGMRPGDPACSGIEVAEFTGAGAAMGAGEDNLVNVAPVFGGTTALLGEAGKITAVSSYRFSSVVPGSGGVAVGLRGKSGEVVTLLVAVKSGRGTEASPLLLRQSVGAVAYTCSARVVTIGADGTAAITL